jgi:hypothetical protein
MDELRDDNLDELGNEGALLDDSIFEEVEIDILDIEDEIKDLDEDELEEEEEILDELDALLAEEEEDMDFFGDDDDF